MTKLKNPVGVYDIFAMLLPSHIIPQPPPLPLSQYQSWYESTFTDKRCKNIITGTGGGREFQKITYNTQRYTVWHFWLKILSSIVAIVRSLREDQTLRIV